ncbi:MAG: hypothetical protein Q7T82_16205 [Armatimonadota bacterium]|nr:hypothetical protein [Armatimonadota bacterium]
MIGLCVVGWLVVLVLAPLYARGVGAILALILFALGTANMMKEKDSPHRFRTITLSWIGPLLAEVARALDRFLSGGTWAALVVGGMLFAGVLTWLWRGYGLILFFALLLRIKPAVRREAVFRAMRDYPWKYWWIMSVAGFVLYVGLSMACYAWPPP